MNTPICCAALLALLPLRGFVQEQAELTPFVVSSRAAADESVPGDWLGAAQSDIARSEYFYSRTPQDELSAPNRAQDLRSRVDADGLTLTARSVPADFAQRGEDDWWLRLATRSVGRGAHTEPLPAGELTSNGERVELDRGALVEWYVNDERGVEQGWTIASPPARHGGPADNLDAPLHLVLAIEGTLSLRVDECGRSGMFVDTSGAHVLRYAGLGAWDALGKGLEVRMQPGPQGVVISVEDQDAVYPITIDPVLSGPAWIAEGDVPNAKFGHSVATAGDVNGDGYSDVIVGAHGWPGSDNPQYAQGRAYVYLGSTSGLAANEAWTAASNQAYALFGSSVSTAGDVNGDGYSDVIVGAKQYHNGESYEGRAYLYLGSASGLQAGPTWMAESDQEFAYFGHSVSTAGDVNGDGYSDVIVGAYRYDNGEDEEGRAYLYLGSPSGLLASAAWTAEGNQTHALFGHSVSTAGDVNGDGYSDVIVGAFGGNVTPGRVYVYLGSASGLAANAAWTAQSDQGIAAHFGVSVSTAGDVNGDGYSDVIVGARGYTNGQDLEGHAFVYLGSPTGLAASAAWSVESNQAYSNFGSSVSTAGDVNGDGNSDVIVGAYTYDNDPFTVGRAFVYLGSASGPANAAWTAEGEQHHAWFGNSVSTAGDVNGDGNADVIVGAFEYNAAQDAEGRAYLYLGSIGSLGTRYCASTMNSSGSVALIEATGSDVVSDQDLIMYAQSVPSDVNGIFFYGPNQSITPFGNGVRCIEGSIQRLPITSAVGDLLTFVVDFAAPQATGIVAGTLNFQAWFRDPADPFGFQLSDGLSILFL